MRRHHGLYMMEADRPAGFVILAPIGANFVGAIDEDEIGIEPIGGLQIGRFPEFRAGRSVERTGLAQPDFRIAQPQCVEPPADGGKPHRIVLDRDHALAAAREEYRGAAASIFQNGHLGRKEAVQETDRLQADPRQFDVERALLPGRQVRGNRRRVSNQGAGNKGDFTERAFGIVHCCQAAIKAPVGNWREHLSVLSEQNTKTRSEKA